MSDPLRESKSADKPPSSPSDRRQSRFACMDGTRLKLSVCPEFRCRRGLLVDVSVGGIGVLLETELKVGTRVVFEVLASAGGPGLSRMAKVRHCRAHAVPESAPWLPSTPPVSAFFRNLFGLKSTVPPPEGWFIGCQFELPMAQEDVDRLLAMLQPSMDGE